jgi:hypothetical protein
VLPTSIASSIALIIPGGRGSELAGALDALAFERGERVRQRGPVGQCEGGIQLEQWHEHEAAKGDVGVRQRQPLRAPLEIAEQEQVDVDRSRGMARPPGPLPAKRSLDALALVEQGLRVEVRLDAEAGVEEVGLSRGVALGLRLVRRRRGDDVQALDLGSGEERARRAQVLEPVALVGAEAEVAAAPLGGQSSRSL